METNCKNPTVWNNSFFSRSFWKLFSNIIFFPLVIWAPHDRPAVQESGLVEDPKILLETFIKIQTVERTLTVQCVQLSSSSQSGFLPCYHLKIKGMHPYFFCPAISRSIPTCIWVQAMCLSNDMEMGTKRPKLPSDRLCSFSPHAEKERCAYWCIMVAVRSKQESVLAAARWLSLLQEEILYGHAEASMYSLFGAATLKYSGFSAAGTFKRPLGLVSFGKKSCW